MKNINEQLFLNKTKAESTDGLDGGLSDNESLSSVENEIKYLENIEKVFEINPELEKIALESIKSGENIYLYRIENKNITRECDGVTSHDDLRGQWFTPNIETALAYLRKSQQTFGLNIEKVKGVNLVIVQINKDQLEDFHVSKNPIASQMDVENDNYIISKNIKREYINLDDIQDKVGNFNNFQKAVEQVKEKVKNFEQKEALRLYKKYLSTIFTDSKIREIFWNGSPNKTEGKFLSLESVSKKEGDIEIAIFDTKQIYMLGSKDDVDSFKKFCSNYNN